MANDRRGSTPPPLGGFIGSGEAAALWRARADDLRTSEHRFDRIEDGMRELHADMGEVKESVEGIKEAETKKAASAEKRNQRIWQVASGVLIVLLAAVIIALFKVFAPIAIGGLEGKAPRVNDRLGEFQDTLEGK